MDEDWVCAICLEGNQDDCHTLVPCNHRFHTACLIEALRRNGPRCPYCRGLPNDHPLIGENHENIQLVVNEIDDADIPDNENVNQQLEEQVNNEIIFEMLEDQNNNVMNINNLVLVRANYLINRVRNSELNNQLRQDIRNTILDNIDIFNNNNQRLTITNTILNSNITDNEKNFLLNIINVAVDNVNLNQEDIDLLAAFVGDNININIDNIINLFINCLNQDDINHFK